MELEHAELTERIIGAAIAVHREIGPGFKESIYQNALQIELRARGMTVDSERRIIVAYREIEVGRHRLDLVVNDLIVLENKRVEALLDRHLAQLRSYLKASGLKHGLLFNFANQVRNETSDLRP
jgi:GxxExxY protein